MAARECLVLCRYPRVEQHVVLKYLILAYLCLYLFYVLKDKGNV